MSQDGITLLLLFLLGQHWGSLENNYFHIVTSQCTDVVLNLLTQNESIWAYILINVWTHPQ